MVPGFSSKKDQTWRKKSIPGDPMASPGAIIPISELCIRCTGRIFAMEGHGMSNTERGMSFIQSESSQGRIISSVEPVECAICHGIFTQLDLYASEIIQRLSEFEFSSFLLGSTFPEETINNESLLQGSYGSRGESIKKEFNRELGKIIENKLKKELDRDDPDIMVKIDTRYMKIDFQVKSIYIYGKYRKFNRIMPQTKWIKYSEVKDTIESIIGEKLNMLTGGDLYYLHGAGREDVDVRMLGNGREFIIESCNPRIRKIDLAKMEEMVNSSGKGIEIIDLSLTTRTHVRKIKEEKHAKVYMATVTSDREIEKESFAESISGINGKVIYQRTPLRVSTSRSDLVRERKVMCVSIEDIQKNSARLRIEAEAGVYIKELISGDHGRTNPNLSDLSGMKLFISELDVIEIKR